MQKFAAVFSIFLVSLSLHAQVDRSVEATIKRVEFENAGVCVFEKMSMGLVVNLYRWSKRHYVCDGNDGLFRLVLRVREEGRPNNYGNIVYTNGVVTKIKFKDL